MTLIEAIQSNNEKVFFELLNSPLPANPLEKKIIDEVDLQLRGSPLYWAVTLGHTHFIASLVRAGVDINKANKVGTTPVFAAACNDQASVIAELHALGANVDMPNSNGATPVFVAAQKGHASAIAALHALGANVNMPQNEGITPLYVAVQNGNIEAISALLEAGANVSTRTPQGTSLELAKRDTTQKGQYIVTLLETHLQQYPNGIKTLVANSEATPLIQESYSEDFVKAAPRYGNPLVVGEAGRDVVTITGGVKGREIALGGGNLSCAEAQNSSDNHSKAVPMVDNIAILKQLKLFFMSNKYKGLESPDCELYNRVLDSHKAMLVYLEEERVHRLFINDEPLEPQNAIKMLSKIIASLQPLSTQSSNITSNTFCATTSPNNTHVQARAGRDVITITGGVTSEGGLRIGGGNMHGFTAYNHFKNQTAGQYNITGSINNSTNMPLGSGNMRNNQNHAGL